MGNWDRYCPNCFLEKTDGKWQCQHCGHDEGESRSPAVLPMRSILYNKYVVGRVLGSPGGFGITYLCWDIKLATRAAIKEFMPRDNAVRDRDGCSVVAHSGKDREFFEYGLKAFLAEARTVAGFDHPNIVKVKDYFEQNHTAYLVMNYYEGVSLAEHVKQQGGRLQEKTALGIISFVLDGLRHVHSKGYLHRDVKPANIYITTERQVILLDFGAARFAIGEHSRSLSVVVTPGYSPFEQYRSSGNQGAWTDIYACGATLYYLVTGQPPQPAPDRIEEDNQPEPKQMVSNLSALLNNGIIQALRVKASDRPQNIEEFKKILGMLQPDPKPVPKPEPEPKPDPPTPPVPIWRRKEAIAIGACLLLVLLAVIMYGNWGRSGVLVVEPNPEDAEVWVDGVYQGRGRLRMEDVSSGKRVVSAKRSGYADEEKPVEVRSGGVTNVSIRLRALQGTLKIVTEPSGAEISVNGVVKGKSPVDITGLSPGTVKVRVSRDGYISREEAVEVVGGEKRLVEWDMQKAMRVLRVVTEPSGAEISVNGVVKGKSPVDVKDIKPGTAKVRASMNTKDYAVREEQVNIEVGLGPQVLEWTLTQSVPKIGDMWKDPVTGMEFMWVPGGCYWMGQTETEKKTLLADVGKEKYEKYHADEGPSHEVCLDGFWMGKTEVTRGQFKKFVEAKEHKTEAEIEGWSWFWSVSGGGKWEKKEGINWRNPGFSQDDRHPVVCVSWNDAHKMLEWISQKGNGKFLLPSEAQWEYACRAGTQSIRFWGNDPDKACTYANVADQAGKKTFNWAPIHECDDGYDYTSPVGRFKPNKFELYDMLGNVSEWCEDVYIADIYSRSDKKNPMYISGGPDRVLRGGSWNDEPGSVRCANRYFDDPAGRDNSLGFRLLRMP